MTQRLRFTNGTIILADRLLPYGEVEVHGPRVTAVTAAAVPAPAGAVVIDLAGGYLAPGFIDLHVHGGAGADFMDGTPEAFETVCRAHARHGTTSLLATSTAASHERILEFLTVCRRCQTANGGAGARVLGAHLYGPYFAPAARGCHPAGGLRPPTVEDFADYLAFAQAILTATIAPELPGAETFARACTERGIRLNVGHSHATFEQVEESLEWGVRHVDHLFCAMSDRARLRQTQTYPMRGGLLEAALYFDELTTEVIADGRHLTRALLLLAYRVKGPNRLALVTDCNRALDLPDGEYWFGPQGEGERILRHDGVGLMPDGQALASGVMGMDHAIRTFHALTGVPLVDAVRMATLTPARIIGRDKDLGSIAVGKLADLVVLDRELRVREVYQGGHLLEKVTG